MACAQLFHQIFWPKVQRRSSATPSNRSLQYSKTLDYMSLAPKYSNNVRNSKLTVRSLSPPKSRVNVQQLVDFLYEDLPHFFDDQGIDPTVYDERIKFQDPITKFESLNGYLFNIALLKTIFRPQFQLHWVKQTGPYEITTRWTVVMEYTIFPWKPELVLTGTSAMGINPETGKFCSHVDQWDSIRDSNFFSLEGFWDIIKQMWIYKTRDLGSPKYQILKRTANYEVRKYPQLIAVEGTDLTDTNQEIARLKEMGGGTAAVIKFSGNPTKDIVLEKEKTLHSSLIADGLGPKMIGCLLSHSNNPGQTCSFAMAMFGRKEGRDEGR